MNMNFLPDVETDLNKIVDCIGIVNMELPYYPLQSERCIATIVSAGFAGYLDDMLGSLHANTSCNDVLKVVLVVNRDDECTQVATKYGATIIPCTLREQQASTAVKSALYSIAHVVDAQQFICLDADMLLLSDITPIFTALTVCRDGSILVCRDAISVHKSEENNSLEKVLGTLYKGHPDDLARLLGTPAHEGLYPLIVNDGLFAGNRKALLMLDSVIRSWPGVHKWVFEFDRTLRNQFLFNLVLAHLQCGVEIEATYNVQLAWEDVDLKWVDGRMHAMWQDQEARVLHFNGRLGRHKYAEWRGLHAQAYRA